jgi:peptidoglycan/xylan/chitin deacetylase (PgdA/CDA1 family)
MSAPDSFAPWKLPVLTYHRIGDLKPGLEPTGTITFKEFEKQLSWLKHAGYETISASHLNEVLQGRGIMPARPVLITFDDGYEELCEGALPALISNGFKATVFIVTKRIGQTNAWDEAAGWGSVPLMSEDQICHWSQQGIDFGSHSRTHSVLTKMSDAELISDLSASAQELGRILQRRVACFAYPYGRSNAVVRAVTARYFDLAFGGEEGLNAFDSDRFKIRRTMVRLGDDIGVFLRRLSNGRSPFWQFRDLRAQVRLRSRLDDVRDWFHSA